MSRQVLSLTRRLAALTVGGGCVLALIAAPARADIHFAVLPAESTVQPGEIFEVELTITEEGSAFNGYDAVVGYDPELLTFIQRPQSVQEGELMTDACSNRFHVFEADPPAGVISVAHVLLCAGVSVTGPGVVYRLQFQAGAENGTTQIALLGDTAFYLAGIHVSPLLTTAAEVRIGTGTPVIPTAPATGLNLRASPNPFNPRTTISFVAAEAGVARLAVFDAQGTRVRQLLDGTVDVGPRAVIWDGHDDAGRRVSSGVYLVRVDLAGRSMVRRVTLAK